MDQYWDLDFQHEWYGIVVPISVQLTTGTSSLWSVTSIRLACWGVPDYHRYTHVWSTYRFLKKKTSLSIIATHPSASVSPIKYPHTTRKYWAVLLAHVLDIFYHRYHHRQLELYTNTPRCIYYNCELYIRCISVLCSSGDVPSRIHLSTNDDIRLEQVRVFEWYPTIPTHDLNTLGCWLIREE